MVVLKFSFDTCSELGNKFEVLKLFLKMKSYH